LGPELSSPIFLVYENSPPEPHTPKRTNIIIIPPPGGWKIIMCEWLGPELSSPIFLVYENSPPEPHTPKRTNIIIIPPPGGWKIIMRPSAFYDGYARPTSS
jgi:hypothetical protein